MLLIVENNHDRNKIDLGLQKALCLQNLHIPTTCLDMYLHIWGSKINTHN